MIYGSKPSGFGQDVFLCFPYISHVKLVTLGWGHFWPQGHNLNKLGKGPLL